MADSIAVALLPFILLLNCINVSKITLNTNNFLIAHFHVSTFLVDPECYMITKEREGR